MNELLGQRPAPSEHDPYYGQYIGRIETESILRFLSAQGEAVRDLATGLAPEGGVYRYAPGKWSVNEVFGHLVDSERIFGMRAACIARGENADLPGFEQDDYVAAGRFDDRPPDSLVREFELLRAANVEMFGGLPSEAWRRLGRANGTDVSVRAIAWILAGHADHHASVLNERYAAAFTL